VRALKGGIPRGYRDHRTPDGRKFTAYLRALVARFGELPADVLPLAREAGRLAVDLDRLADALETALHARRTRDQRAVRRQQRNARAQLLALEQRLEGRLAKRPQGSSPMAAIAAAPELAR
jgi:hypothetical protein